MQFFLTSFLLFSGFFNNDQIPEGYVGGRVFDKNTQEALAGVYIIYGKELGTITGGDGRYFFTAKEGKLNITFRSIGYSSVNKEVTVIINDTVELDLGMEMILQEIDQVVISANRTEQRIAELSVSMDIIKTAFLSGNHISDAQ